MASVRDAKNPVTQQASTMAKSFKSIQEFQTFVNIPADLQLTDIAGL